jgi:hypothetical protein
MKKHIKKEFQKEFNKGKSETEIISKLSKGFEIHKVEKIAKKFTTLKLKNKYKKINEFLISLLGLVIGLKAFDLVFTFFVVFQDTSLFYYELIFQLFAIALGVWTVISLGKYIRIAYFSSILLTIGYIMILPDKINLLTRIFTNTNTMVNSLYLISLFIILILSIYLEIKLFPKEKGK